jgi:hypothetical protein
MRGDQSGARSARTISPELTTGHALQAARDAQADQHRGQRATLLADQIPQLRQLYRAATARYAGVAVALVQAVLDGTDPHAALHAPPVPLDEASGRPTELACPGTGLPGVDADIAARHRPRRSTRPPRICPGTPRTWRTSSAPANSAGCACGHGATRPPRSQG